MKTNTKIYELANEMYAQASEGITKLQEEQKDLIKTIQTDDIDSALEKLGLVINCIASKLRCVAAEEAQFPGFLTKFSTTDVETLKEIELTVSSKLKAERKFKERKNILVDDNFVANAGEFMINVLFSAYYTEEAYANITAVNERLEEIYAENEITKKVLFGVDASAGRVISIDNDVVVLNAEIEKALEASKIGVMVAGDEYSELVREEATKKFVDVMKTVSITPEIIKKNIDVVASLLDLRTKKHANKIIREGYHKQAKYLKDATSGVGYVSEKVGEANVFALVVKNEAGDFEVVLNPFNADTLEPVDVNVVDLIK